MFRRGSQRSFPNRLNVGCEGKRIYEYLQSPCPHHAWAGPKPLNAAVSIGQTPAFSPHLHFSLSHAQISPVLDRPSASSQSSSGGVGLVSGRQCPCLPYKAHNSQPEVRQAGGSVTGGHRVGTVAVMRENQSSTCSPGTLVLSLSTFRDSPRIPLWQVKRKIQTLTRQVQERPEVDRLHNDVSKLFRRMRFVQLGVSGKDGEERVKSSVR